MPKLQLTKTAIDAIRHPPSGQQFYWDTNLRGFGLLVGSRTKSFVVECSVRGNSRRTTIGRYGDFTLAQARTQAQALLGDMRGRGIDIVAERQAATANNMTLKEGWELYRTYLEAKGRSLNTITQYDETLRWWLSDWLDKPLTHITRARANERHLKLSKDNGRFAANKAMTVLRAVWNRARRAHPSLPEAPTANVDFNYEAPRQLDGQAPLIPYDKLPDWYQAVMQTENPIRRDLFLWLLFTGNRSEEARSMRWSQVDFKNRTVHFPVTKTRPLTLPLSDYLIELLERRKACNATRAHFGESQFVFPGHTATGYAAVPLLHGAELKRHPLRWTPHILRHTYVTVAENYCAIPAHHSRLLVNHAGAKADVHNRYNHTSMELLRKSQQAVTDALKVACGIVGE